MTDDHALARLVLNYRKKALQGYTFYFRRLEGVVAALCTLAPQDVANVLGNLGARDVNELDDLDHVLPDEEGWR